MRHVVACKQLHHIILYYVTAHCSIKQYHQSYITIYQLDLLYVRCTLCDNTGAVSHLPKKAMLTRHGRNTLDRIDRLQGMSTNWLTMM